MAEIRRFLEPGPIVLVSSAWAGQTNIMTMGWHMVMGFQPSVIGCYIWSDNHSFDMIRKSRECVINIPTENLAPKVVGIGNTSGRDVDKFKQFGLSAVTGEKVAAPLVGECYAEGGMSYAPIAQILQQAFDSDALRQILNLPATVVPLLDQAAG